MKKLKSLPADTYQIAVAVARSYNELLKRQGKLSQEQESRNAQKIKAVEESLAEMTDDTERELVRRNLIGGVNMEHIPLPMSIPTMKRARKKFLRILAEKLHEA